jgi:TetR/AcrR family transcriptional regulator, repressor for uid operon
MNIHSICASLSIPLPSAERRQQILRAAAVCFAKCGFHQTTMHDISEQAGISVGLIYRYFENKNAVITAMAEEHQREMAEVFAQAGEASTLLEALEIVFTRRCPQAEPNESAFVVDLFAEASRNPYVADLIRKVDAVCTNGLADLISRSPEAKNLPDTLSARRLAEIIHALSHGLLMQDVILPDQTGACRMELVRTLCHSLFGEKEKEPVL